MEPAGFFIYATRFSAMMPADFYFSYFAYKPPAAQDILSWGGARGLSGDEMVKPPLEEPLYRMLTSHLLTRYRHSCAQAADDDTMMPVRRREYPARLEICRRACRACLWSSARLRRHGGSLCARRLAHIGTPSALLAPD